MRLVGYVLAMRPTGPAQRPIRLMIPMIPARLEPMTYALGMGKLSTDSKQIEANRRSQARASECSDADSGGFPRRQRPARARFHGRDFVRTAERPGRMARHQGFGRAPTLVDRDARSARLASRMTSNASSALMFFTQSQNPHWRCCEIRGPVVPNVPWSGTNARSPADARSLPRSSRQPFDLQTNTSHIDDAIEHHDEARGWHRCRR